MSSPRTNNKPGNRSQLLLTIPARNCCSHIRREECNVPTVRSFTPEQRALIILSRSSSIRTNNKYTTAALIQQRFAYMLFSGI